MSISSSTMIRLIGKSSINLLCLVMSKSLMMLFKKGNFSTRRNLEILTQQVWLVMSKMRYNWLRRDLKLRKNNRKEGNKSKKLSRRKERESER